MRSAGAAGLCALVATACGGVEAGGRAVEVLWDEHGVSHVIARDDVGLFRGFGFAQGVAHGPSLLGLYAHARGRAAEVFGEARLAEDRATWDRGVPDRAAAWYAEQDPSFRVLLDAFAEGVNAGVRAHPGRIPAHLLSVLPVTGVDPLAHVQRLLHFGLMAPDASEARALLARGSNAWAVSPERSASGHALLVAQPHLPWNEPWLFHEARLELDGDWRYGVALVGLPVLGIAFGPDCGWTHTLNPHDGADLYELEGAEGGYRFDGAISPFEERAVELRVRRADGRIDVEHHVVRRSIHGPIVAEMGGRLLALRVAGLARSGVLHQWWRMARARDLEGFRAALAMHQLPTFHVVYADRAGHLLLQYAGAVPRTDGEEHDRSALLDGSRPALVWNEEFALDELPAVVDPASGWLQNANDPPWTATFPGAPDPADYAPQVAPRFMHLAAQRSARAMRRERPPSLEDLVVLARDTGSEAAERLVPELVRIAAASGDARLARAGTALERWDLRFEPASRGAVLFATFFAEYQRSGDVFAVPWEESDPLDTPRGIADPARALVALTRAIDTVERVFGDADVPWGEAYRLRDDGLDTGIAGGMRGLGVLRAAEFTLDRDGRARAVSGDSYVAAIEFSTPPRALVQLVYGNGRNPLGRSRSATLAATADGHLRPALLHRDDVVAGPHRRQIVPLR